MTLEGGGERGLVTIVVVAGKRALGQGVGGTVKATFVTGETIGVTTIGLLSTP